MYTLVLSLVPIALLLSALACAVVRSLSLRAGALDTDAMAGQEKMARRAIPNTGGIGIVLAILVPMLVVLGVSYLWSDEKSCPDFLLEHIELIRGVRSEAALGLWLIGSALLLHVLGLIDDRTPLGALGKLVIMLAPAILVAWPMDTRLLTMLDPIAGGPWLSMLVTVLWIVCVTNAMNFIDNMDGYAGGVAAIASGGFMVSALMQGQWFVAGVLALVCGASLGFLVWNFPPARLFMGDGGSLVLGFLLAFLTVRTTFVPESAGGEPFESGRWYALLMPLVVLGVPLYDFTSVTLIRLSQGKSPFKGDLQHFSHRLAKRGLSVRTAMGVIYGFTLLTAVAGVLLVRSDPTQAVLLGVLIVLVFGVMALLEYGSSNQSVQADRGTKP